MDAIIAGWRLSESPEPESPQVRLGWAGASLCAAAPHLTWLARPSCAHPAGGCTRRDDEYRL